MLGSAGFAAWSNTQAAYAANVSRVNGDMRIRPLTRPVNDAYSTRHKSNASFATKRSVSAFGNTHFLNAPS
jgi:hypothetical protein